jgi:hypothetical protein
LQTGRAKTYYNLLVRMERKDDVQVELIMVFHGVEVKHTYIHTHEIHICVCKQYVHKTSIHTQFRLISQKPVMYLYFLEV